MCSGIANMAEIAVKWGILLVRTNSIFDVPKGRLWGFFFNESFRKSY
jgi:hypothetical protein